MNILLLMKGLLIGFSIAAPVGPIGVLCIRRTLAEGRKVGFVSGLGAASADAVYGAVAGFGLSWVSTFLIEQVIILRLAGGLFLLYLGIKTIFTRPAEKNTGTVQNSGLWKAYASTFFVTLTNPMTILSFMAIFAGLGLAGGNANMLAAAILVAGVFCGSALWWLLLSSGVSLLGKRVQSHHLTWINRAAGLILLMFGMAVWYSVIAS